MPDSFDEDDHPGRRAINVQTAIRKLLVEPVIIIKLSLPFKQIGMSAHRDVEAIADGVPRGEMGSQALQRRSSIMRRCTNLSSIWRKSGWKMMC